MNPFQAENDTLLLSTDANPSPGFSRVRFFVSVTVSLFIRDFDQIATRSKNDISIITRIPGTTIGAGPFFQRTAILHVMTNAIRVLEPGAISSFCRRGTATLIPFFHADGTERQIIKDADGNMPRPKIRACSISDPFVLIIREDDSIGLFIGETERGKIRRKDMSPMGDKVRSFVSLPL